MDDYEKEVWRKTEEAIRKRLAPLVFETQAVIQENCPVDNGHLRSSIEVETTKSGWIIGTNLDYAEFVEYDTKPHIIEPKNKEALRFNINRRMGPKGSHFIFAKRVHHPGTRGHHMFLKGMQHFEENIERVLSK